MNKRLTKLLLLTVLPIILASCGGGGGGDSPSPTAQNVTPSGSSPTPTSTPAPTVPSTTTANGSPVINSPSAPPSVTLPNSATPSQFTAQLVSAPGDGATVSGVLHLQVQGNGIQNVEILPGSSYTPIYGRFAVSADHQSATIDFDTKSLPDGPVTLRVSAFDVPPATPGAREIIAMPPRTWQVKNAASTPTPASPAVSNTVPIYLDAGPTGTALNRPYVDVTICRPGTNICQTIDHVLLDTGSTGLRVQTISPTLNLPAKTDATGNTFAECEKFSGGAIYEWGPVRSADIRIGGETALNVPIHVVNDPSFTNAPPCATAGSQNDGGNVQTKNAILGIGPAKTDCDFCTTLTPKGGDTGYYACNATSCVGTLVPKDSQIANPIALFANDNNGYVISIPPVGSNGTTSTTGLLTFGLGTNANNLLGQAQIYRTDSFGRLYQFINGIGFFTRIDTGNPAIDMQDASLPLCGIIYCPPNMVSKTATIVALDRVTQGTATFNVSNPLGLPAGTVLANAALTSANTTLGLPFFFGRRFASAIDGASTPSGVGPFVAF